MNHILNRLLKFFILFSVFIISSCHIIPNYTDFTGKNNSALFTDKLSYSYTGEKAVSVYYLKLTNMSTLTQFSFETKTINSVVYLKCYLVKYSSKNYFITSVKLNENQKPLALLKLNSIFFTITKNSFNYTNPSAPVLSNPSPTTTTVTQKRQVTHLFGESFFYEGEYSNSAISSGSTGYFIISVSDSTLVTDLNTSVIAPLVATAPAHSSVKSQIGTDKLYKMVNIKITATFEMANIKALQPTATAIAQSVTQTEKGLSFTIANTANAALKYSDCQLTKFNSLFILFDKVGESLIPKQFGIPPLTALYFPDSDPYGFIPAQKSITLFIPAKDIATNMTMDSVILFTGFSHVE